MRGIEKRFGTVVANRDVHLEISAGDILGLLGENGAGKTTLMNILYGLYRQEEGSVLINGEVVDIRSPKDSRRLRIGMIHQHFMLVDQHTVLENIALGDETVPFFFPRRAVRPRVEALAEDLGLDVDLDKKIYELSAGEQQRVEIIKALYRNADLLIMDEPTSVLTPQETEQLFATLRSMSENGHTVILISHKLEEIMAICNRVIVLRKGEVTGEANTADVQKTDLARMMIGRSISSSYPKADLEPGEPILRVSDLHVLDDRGLPATRGLSFEVCENEILGIAGVSGNGQREAVQAICGLRSSESGSVTLHGEEISNEAVRTISDLGLGHVPEDRMVHGIVGNLFLFENAVLKKHHQAPYSAHMRMDYREVRDHADALVSGYQVSAPSVSVPAKNLSGGNIQKLILGREISSAPSLLIASHPTYGLDVGAAEYVRLQLIERRDSGGAVLLVSEDLEELFAVCDRIAVMFEGKVMGVVDPSLATMEEVGLLMAGVVNESERAERSSVADAGIVDEGEPSFVAAADGNALPDDSATIATSAEVAE